MSDRTIYKDDIFALDRNVFGSEPNVATLFCYGQEPMRIFIHKITWHHASEAPFTICIKKINDVSEVYVITGCSEDLRNFARSLQLECTIFD